MKLLSIVVPSYNSQDYLEACLDSLVKGGERVEVLVVDDGSTDRTGEIADAYQEKYPTIVRAIHQPNGGHGEGVNQGIRNARGIYYKVVDSDDWVDVPALHKALDKLRQFVRDNKLVDMMVCNYVYEHVESESERVMHYRNVFPRNKVFCWEQIGRFRPSQYLLMHSVIYRTQLLRDCGLELPKHTFYVDNIFVYQPLPSVKNIYYLDVDLYRYFIGRSDQSVNEKVMVTRVDQQLRVTYQMIDSHDLRTVGADHKKLARYMFNYLAMMMAISSIFLVIDGRPEALGKKTQLWEYLRTVDSGLYHKMKYRAVSAFTNFPGYQGRKLSVQLYRLARKIYKFN